MRRFKQPYPITSRLISPPFAVTTNQVPIHQQRYYLGSSCYVDFLCSTSHVQQIDREVSQCHLPNTKSIFSEWLSSTSPVLFFFLLFFSSLLLTLKIQHFPNSVITLFALCFPLLANIHRARLLFLISFCWFYFCHVWLWSTVWICTTQK